MAARPTVPEFLRSPVLGELIAGHLADLADATEAGAMDSGQSRVRAAEVRMLRATAREITEYVGAEQ